MLVDKNLKFISQRTFPQLALVEIDLLENKGLLFITQYRLSDMHIFNEIISHF